MKTIIIFLLFINSFIFADSLLLRESSWSNYSDCITDHYYKNNRLYFVTSKNNGLNRIKLSDYKNIEIKSGYIYENDSCIQNYKSLSEYTLDSTFAPNYKNLTSLGLSQNDFNLMMAFSGIIISFLFLFGLFRWI